LTREVAKTLAVVPEARGLGLGGHLLDRVDEAARLRGFGAVVHALMHEDNRSRAMSDRRGARVFRRYVLFERQA
jgi:GNAT superfamily N-acetyltransferase